MRLRRWSLRGSLLLMVVAAVLLIGRGLGLLGTAGVRSGSSPGNAPAEPDPIPPPAGAQSAGAGAGAPLAGPASRSPGVREGAAEGVGGTASAEERTHERVAPSADADRAASLVALAHEAAALGQFAHAAGALADLERQVPSGAAAVEVGRLRQEVQLAMTAAVEQVMQQIADGRVLAAAAALDRLLADGHDATTAAIDAAAAQRAWPVLATTRLPAQDLGANAPLPADRQVRLLRDGQERTGRVVSALPHEVTVRVADPRGVTFPTVPAIAIEPVDATPAEARQMALAAAVAGNGRLTRLWVACGLARAGAAPPPELTALRLALP